MSIFKRKKEHADISKPAAEKPDLGGFGMILGAVKPLLSFVNLSGVAPMICDQVEQQISKEVPEKIELLRNTDGVLFIRKMKQSENEVSTVFEIPFDIFITTMINKGLSHLKDE